MKDNIVNIFGPKLTQHIMPIDLPKITYLTRKLKEKNFGYMMHDIQYIANILLANRVHGYISKPTRETGRNTGDRQFLYINSRPVDYPRFAKVNSLGVINVMITPTSPLLIQYKIINEVYRQANPGQSAIFILNLTVETGNLSFHSLLSSFFSSIMPDSYDVNVTPDKRTIMLHDEASMLDALKVCLC